MLFECMRVFMGMTLYSQMGMVWAGVLKFA
jgi:hypothetical protein